MRYPPLQLLKQFFSALIYIKFRYKNATTSSLKRSKASVVSGGLVKILNTELLGLWDNKHKNCHYFKSLKTCQQQNRLTFNNELENDSVIQKH